MKKYVLKIRAADKEIFEAIRKNKKTVETRVDSPAYQDIAVGDMLIFSCAGKKLSRPVKRIRKFKSIRAIAQIYPITAINPSVSTEAELRAMYYGFSGYKERIKKYGILAFELTSR